MVFLSARLDASKGAVVQLVFEGISVETIDRPRAGRELMGANRRENLRIDAAGAPGSGIFEKCLASFYYDGNSA